MSMDHTELYQLCLDHTNENVKCISVCKLSRTVSVIVSCECECKLFQRGLYHTNVNVNCIGETCEGSQAKTTALSVCRQQAAIALQEIFLKDISDFVLVSNSGFDEL